MNGMQILLSLVLAASFLQSSSLPLVIVVRDGQGHPLAGLTLRLLEAGPPTQPFDSCVTDNQGQCRLMIPPGAYIVQFEGGGWGHPFIPAEQQNAALSGGGFGIYFEPSGQEQVVTFVVGQQDGQLVPLWDMSRDPDAPPQPYSASSDPFNPSAGGLADIDLGPIAAAATEDAQIAESTLSVGGPSTPLPTVTSVILPGGNSPASGIGLGLIALLVIAGLTIAVALVAARLRRKGAR
jgi:hypothetical protein